MKLLEYTKKVEPAVALGRRVHATPAEMSDWSQGKRPVPIKRCVAIELATDGKVTRQELRPDDWENIWPELVGRAA